MILTAASEIYGRVAGWRRQWYSARPSRRRRLSRPVISIGNLRVGGAGKTPLVAAIAALLQSRGERPDILSRGYSRRSHGHAVVSNTEHVLADLETAGDEPLMLARRLKGVPVLVSHDRFQIGQLAEREFNTSVHLLDDGFQHLPLARDVDLLVVDEADLSDRLLPAGRLREPLTAARAADALLTSASPEAAARLQRATAVTALFRVTRSLGPPYVFLGDHGRSLAPGRGFVVTGIARPERFFDDLRSAGWTLTGTLPFQDHHWFTAADLARIEREARASGADLVLTTEKDLPRLERHETHGVTIAAVPLEATIEPSFGDWIIERLARSRR